MRILLSFLAMMAILAFVSGRVMAKPGGMPGGNKGNAPELMQNANVKRILGDLQRASLKALDAVPDLKSRMTADLTGALAIQNPKMRRQALDAYRKKYESDYQTALIRAGIDVMAYAKMIGNEGKKLYKITPVYEDLGNAFAIVFRVSSADLQRALQPLPSDRVIPYADYARSSGNSCAGFTGSSVSDRADGFHVATSGGFAAGCSTHASRSVNAPTSARETATGSQSARINLNGTVAGIVGLGVCELRGSLGLHGGNEGFQGAYRQTTLVAPILWIASWSMDETWTHTSTRTGEGFFWADYGLTVGAAAGVLGGADCHGDIGGIVTRVNSVPR